MSRIGKKPIVVPEKVTVSIKELVLDVKGPSGTLSREIPVDLQVKVENKQILISPKSNKNPKVGSLHGMFRTMVNNMVIGVVTPWKKDLEVHGVGYRMNKSGQVLNVALGFSHPVDIKIPATIQFTVDPKQTNLSMSCPDKELLGNMAAMIRSLRPPEPYKGKGVRYVGEHILRKAGKAAGTVGGGGAGKK